FFKSSPYPFFSSRSSASSRRIITSPSLARVRTSSRSSGSVWRFNPLAPPSRNARCQLSSSWAGTWLSRQPVSSDSPRGSRNTSSVFRCALHRSGSSGVSSRDGAGSFDDFDDGRSIPSLLEQDCDPNRCPKKPGPIYLVLKTTAHSSVLFSPPQSSKAPISPELTLRIAECFSAVPTYDQFSANPSRRRNLVPR